MNNLSELQLDVLAEVFSIGVCTGIPKNDDNLLNKADTALYQAKHKGRNRCISLPLCETEEYLEQ